MNTLQKNYQKDFKGNDRVLIGFVLGLLTFWLFSMTLLNIDVNMNEELSLDISMMNLAVSITSLFSGLFIVISGGLADRFGRVKILNVGFILGTIGALLIAITPPESIFTAPILLLGRIFQGLSGACIMPSSLALLRVYWDEKGRQRAVSIWSMGSWGGTSFSALFGGFAMDTIGWRAIFIVSAILSLVGMFLVREIPENKADEEEVYKFDIWGVITFIFMLVSLQVGLLQGSNWGWSDYRTLLIFGIALVFFIIFIVIENKHPHPFVDFNLFKNKTFTGATISNFILNGTAGVITISLSLLQLGGDLSASESGILTIGYGISILSFIRIGERLLQRFGPRKPMIWACLILLISVALLLPTNVMRDTYLVLVVISYFLFGLGLAFYATPSTDAALSNLPLDQAGSGSGIYKMASSLGASFGLAISTAIFTGIRLMEKPICLLDNVIEFVGRQDNIHIRQAALLALLFNALVIGVAIMVILKTIPKEKKN